MEIMWARQHGKTLTSLGKYVELKSLEELEDIINQMIHTGYICKNDYSATQFMATGENSEFGIRAKVLLDKIREIKEGQHGRNK